MANKPLPNLLPADLPENWQTNQIVAPAGADVGLAEQYGYNYLMAQLNAAQQAINNINEAFPGLASLTGGKIPLAQLPMDAALSNTSENPLQNKVINAALAGKVPTTRKVNNKALSADISLTAADVGALASNGKAGTAGTADTAKACSGNAATATKLATARSIRTNLASGSAVNFDGSANITPGVTGVLPVANGGTGANSAAAARTALGITAANLGINSLKYATGILALSSNSEININKTVAFNFNIVFIILTSFASYGTQFLSNNNNVLIWTPGGSFTFSPWKASLSNNVLTWSSSYYSSSSKLYYLAIGY